MMKIKKNIVIMYVISFLQGMVFYSAIATLYRQAVGISVFQITIIESISLALALILELPWGILAEKIGYKNTMIVCNVLYFVSKIVFWKASGFGMFLVERILLSVVLAGASGVDASILYLSSSKQQAQKVFSVYDGLRTAGMLAASGVYTVFLHGQYRMAGLFTVFSYGIAMIFTFFLKEVKNQEEQKQSTTKEFVVILKDTLHRKELLLFLVGIALFSECHQTITVFLNQLQYMRSGMTDQMMGLAYIVMTIVGLASVWSAKCTEKLGRRRMGTLMIGMSAICCLLLMLTKNPWISVVSILALRMLFSLMMPLVEVIKNQQVKHENRATTLSIYSVIMDAVAITTNLLFGKASDISLVLALAMGCILSLIAMTLFRYTTKEMN